METERKTSIGKRMLSTVGAGVIGSVMTLAVVANTDLLQEKSSATENKTEQVATAYDVQQTSANAGASLSDMVENASKAIVGVVNYQNEGNRFAQDVKSIQRGAGSGVIYQIRDGKALVATNNHVIEGAQKIEVVLENGDKKEAKLIGKDVLSDLAVLEIDAKDIDTFLEFGDSSKLRAGDPVVAIGNPLGLDFSGSVTKGIVSAPARTIDVNTSAGAWEMDVIQTDAAINPGNSGGALLNENGQVIGINSLKIAESGVEGLGFAIPSNVVVPILEDLTQNGQIERPYIGIGLVDLAQVPYQYVQQLPQSVKGGVMVANVDPDSAAGKAGLKEQDVIVSLNGQEVDNSLELRKFLYSDLKVGQKVSVAFYRGDQLKNVEMTLTSNQTKTE